MTRRNPFTNANIAERPTWPETKAALRGPGSYDELGVLTHKQRGEMIRLSRVEAEREKTFLDEVACCINGYRRRKRCHTQESPAAVAASMRQLTDMVEAYARDMAKFPDYMIGELKPPLPTADWFEHAREMIRRKERLVKGHRPRSITPDLSYHAFALQRIAVRYSADYLAADQEAMQRWLAEALVVSGERPVGKNTRTAYFEQLMLKQ